jgi:hypothetical protein
MRAIMSSHLVDTITTQASEEDDIHKHLIPLP